MTRDPRPTDEADDTPAEDLSQEAGADQDAASDDDSGASGWAAAIREHLARLEYRPVKAGALAKALGVTKKRMPEFREALRDLVDSGRVREGTTGQLRLRGPAGTIEGVVKKTSTGAGYVVPRAEMPAAAVGDVYVEPRDMRDAHTGDVVLVQLLSKRRTRGQRCGRVIEVVSRSTRTFVGTYQERAGQGYVQIDGRTVVEPILVGDPGAKGARVGDKVVVEMLRFPSHDQRGEGVLTKVLGPRGEPGVDTLSIIHEFALPDDFPERVLQEARDAVDRYTDEVPPGRRDLTAETIVTIDPADARDFDDAISLDRDDDGAWRLGVHIADVAEFVSEGSALDAEARLRGNSVYLPRRVLPMLPEALSNGLCSLQQGKVRWTLSAFVEFAPDGAPLRAEFSKSAIRVSRRFAYEEVLPVVREPDRFKASVPAKVRALLGRMHELAMLLRRRRFAHGALNLDLAEIELDFDADGRMTGAHETVHDESHQMIEEFMLAANVAVAGELARRKLDFLRRIHGSPDLLKLQHFAAFADVLGFRLRNPQSRRELQGVLDRVRATPLEHAVNFALLRSMKQAEYSPQAVGHYALAEENYCHFTSPIRRYPDLHVHRLLRAVLERGKVESEDELELLKLGKHCSATERRADAAERELIRIKLLTYLSQRIGIELDATITGVEPYGFFCQGKEIPAEGLVHVSALAFDDDYAHDPNTFSLVGRRKGRQFRLGDTIRVKVSHVDVDRRVLDFAVLLPRGRGARAAGDGETVRGEFRGRGFAGAPERGKSAGGQGASGTGRTLSGRAALGRGKREASDGSRGKKGKKSGSQGRRKGRGR